MTIDHGWAVLAGGGFLLACAFYVLGFWDGVRQARMKIRVMHAEIERLTNLDGM